MDITAYYASLGHKVIAFEPMPFNNALLNMSTDYNNFNIKVICDAISDKHNIMSMNFNPSNKGGCSLREDFDETSTNKNDITQQITIYYVNLIMNFVCN